MKKPKFAANIIFILWLIILLALFVFAVYVDVKKLDIYLSGCVFSNDTVRWLLIILCNAGVLVISISEMKRPADDETKKIRRKRFRLTAVCYTVLICLGIFTLADDISKDLKGHTDRLDLDDKRGIVLAETSYKFAGSKDEKEYNVITVYKRNGIFLKAIDTVQESIYYANDSMIANGQYSYEYRGNTCIVSFDYGGLQNGMKWKDEYEDDPPRYITEEYEVE